MNILVSANKNYLKSLITVLYSLSLNTNEKTINVYFINVSVSNDEIKNFKKIINNKISKIKLYIIDVNTDILNTFKIKDHFSVETYSRLLLLKVLPEDIKRILWLDADIIIHNNIDDLYNMNFGEKALIACKSINQNDEENKKALSFEKNQLYFNAGIILFNIEYLREKYNDDFLMSYAIENNGKLKWLDQDVLNAVLGKETKIIEYEKYNFMHFSGTKILDKQKNYLLKDNCILHYIGCIKPWNYKFDCWTYKFWKKYAKKSGAYSCFFFHKNYILHKIYMLKK